MQTTIALSVLFVPFYNQHHMEWCFVISYEENLYQVIKNMQRNETMRIFISIVIALTVVGGTLNLFGEKPAEDKKFEELVKNINGEYLPWDGVKTDYSVAKNLRDKTPHEFEGVIKTVMHTGSSLPFGAYEFTNSLYHCRVDTQTKKPYAHQMHLARQTLRYNNLLKKGNDVWFEVDTFIYRINEGEIFRMPDNTEWKAVAIDVQKMEVVKVKFGNGMFINGSKEVKKGRVFFEVKAIPGTVNPGLKNSKNNSLIVPLNSEVTLCVRSFFDGPNREGLYSTITSTSYTPDGKIKLLLKGKSSVESKDKNKVIKNQEYENIKAGQKVELLPGEWHIIKKIVKPNPKKKIRGWIEFDTTPTVPPKKK